MRIPILFVLTALLFDTAAAGYRHIYENIFTFYVYRLELNLPEGQRIVGVKCTAADPETHKCLDREPKYMHCQGTVPTTIRGTTIPDTCSLREFLSHISGNKGYKKNDPLDNGEVHNFRDQTILGRRVGENSLDFDIDYAVDKLSQVKFGDFQAPSYAKVKDGDMRYVASVRSLGRRVSLLRTRMSTTQLEENKQLFTKVHLAVNGVIDDRLADYHSYLLPKLNKLSTKSKFETETVLGNRKVLRYDKTVANLLAKQAGIPQSSLQSRVDDFNNIIDKHAATAEAKNHLPTLKEWQKLPSLMGDVPGCNPKD